MSQPQPAPAIATYQRTPTAFQLPPTHAYSKMYKRQRWEIARALLSPDHMASLVVRLQITNSTGGFWFDATAEYEFLLNDGAHFSETIQVPKSRGFDSKGVMTDVRPRFETWLATMFGCFCEDIQSCDVHRLCKLPVPQKPPEPPPKSKTSRPAPASLNYEPPKILARIRPPKDTVQPAAPIPAGKETEVSKRKHREGNGTKFKRLTPRQTVDLGICVRRDIAMLGSGTMTADDIVQKYSKELEIPHLKWGMARALIRSMEIPLKVKIVRLPANKANYSRSRERLPILAIGRLLLRLCKDLDLHGTDVDDLKQFMEFREKFGPDFSDEPAPAESKEA